MGYHNMTATLTAGNLHIPAELLKKHGLSVDARVEIEDRTDGILIAPSAPQKRVMRSMSDLVGFLGTNSNALNTLMEERRKDRELEDRLYGSE